MLIEILLLIMAVPVGLLLAWLADDEFKAGRKWVRGLFVVSFAFALLFWMYGIYYVTLTLVFMSITSLVSLIKGN